MFSRRSALTTALVGAVAALAPVSKAQGIPLAPTQEPATTVSASELRGMLIEESGRFGAHYWADYKQRLWEVELLLRNAGVEAPTVRSAIMELDEAAVGLLTVGEATMLDLGMEAGQMLATGDPFVIHLPDDEVCHSCNGGGGQHDGPACDGRINDDEACPVCQGTGITGAEPIVLISVADLAVA